MITLGIETSCDETGVALYDDARGLLGEALHSQVALHASYGGVVPELASRDHVRRLLPLLEQALAQAGCTLEDVGRIAYTRGPGLAGALLVGASVASGLGLALGKPVVGIHHLEGHLLSPLLGDPRPEFPFVALLVSGGHTQLMAVEGVGRYALLGETVDDAAGEAFDKVGRLLGLPYPGGPAIQQAADRASRHDVSFPRAWLGDSFDFSFSGLKTAARRMIAAETGGEGTSLGETPLPEDEIAEMAEGFQESVVDVLVTKTVRAAREVGARSVVLGGGVAANRPLRDRLAQEAGKAGIPLVVPRPSLCTDNGAMIGAAAARRLEAGVVAGLDLDARPSLPLARR